MYLGAFGGSTFARAVIVTEGCLKIFLREVIGVGCELA